MLQLRDQYPLSSDEIANRSYGQQQVFILLLLMLIYWGILILRDIDNDIEGC